MPSYKVYKQSAISKTSTLTNAKNIIEKIHKNNHLTIGKYHLRENSIFYIDINDSPDAVKTYTVLSGKLVNLKTHEVYAAGDFILIGQIDEIVSLHCLEDSIVLVHAQGNTSVEKFEDSNAKLNALMNDLQAKDHYTKLHSDRVFQLVKQMALKLGYHSSALHNINKAARFHDIGKLFIEDEILNKPAKLTADEFNRIKEHTFLGEDLILKTYGETVYAIITQHHERLDGSGYPKGLRGSEILEEAKILAVCDVYDAMTSNRVYSQAKTPDEAIKELESLAGTLYDEKLIQVLKIIVNNQ
ncbi:HD-GYP domain-containing protein [Fusibacter tunisiensis]|uniref:HD-GYP domain-containing protein (C-di-GMP phosphodiesterase class II) n=1 Tax=Fusibacter tunisiensis TaxID=1008308 RepID=A0ABS2MN97_9FIRM|nr:HD domain-containing phosphohydrolase [Fusibacter tunisiensis]MBM7560873.1 HD-GYP domain-containing protein (c-di-GMP phosphodiesterase class II) [Fusibacter tunisiensis]